MDSINFGQPFRYIMKDLHDNDKFTINEHDCAIAVSELDFDLSVYDIFGMLGYGASLIVLNEMNKREPYIWKKILCEKRVTIYWRMAFQNI